MLNKKRVIEVLNYLKENTNQNNPVKTEDIIAFLESEGYSVERKAIYSDVKQINDMGISIERTHKGYYFDGELFDLAELKILVDLVNASNFLSNKKTMEINKKLSTLTNRFDRTLIDNGNYVNNKSSNEEILYNIDSLTRAIEEKKSITFSYFDLDTYGKKVYRKHDYKISPYNLIVETNRYYLIGYDLKHHDFINFRLDKMENVRTIHDEYCVKDFDINDYMNKTFTMYRGESKNLTLKCDNDLFQEVSQQFGNNLLITKREEKQFCCNVDTSISPTFFSWIFSFKNKIVILAPQDVRTEYLDYCKAIIDMYK